jgi:hypothetical protein
MEEKKVIAIQLAFLNRIKNILGPGKSLVFELSELLGISTDSVYRRLRGETWLTTEEIAVLCKHFNLSFDIVSENLSGKTTFQYSLIKDVESYIAHWESTLNILRQIAAATDKQITYGAVDIPIFHHFNFPELASFKLFYWMREVVNEPMLKDSVFNLDWIYPELLERSREIYTTYCQIPSVEIWTDSTVNSLLKQIEYYWEMGLFADKALAITVIDRAIEEIEHIHNQAENCQKRIDENHKGEELKFYMSDIELGNNCVYVKTDNTESVYMGFLTFNTMVTNNEQFCKESLAWLSNITRKSTLLSGIAQKQRYQFFKGIVKRFESLKSKIEES